MDSKIILAVLIVALIGIVAATYQNETNDMINSLANVATEEPDAVESVTDLAEASVDEASSVEVDESIVLPDSSVNSKVVPKQKPSSNNNNNPTVNTVRSTSNSTQSNINRITSQNTSNIQTNPSNTNSQNNTASQGISEAQAMSIAKNQLPKSMTSDYQKVSETIINNEKIYDVNLYQNGEVIASYEINSDGRVVGGAVKGEAPEV